MAINFALLDSMALYENEQEIWAEFWGELTEQEKQDLVNSL
jgi:hypothetical protein